MSYISGAHYESLGEGINIRMFHYRVFVFLVLQDGTCFFVGLHNTTEAYAVKHNASDNITGRGESPSDFQAVSPYTWRGNWGRLQAVFQPQRHNYIHGTSSGSSYSILSNSSLAAPQTGHTQSSGTSSKGVPGLIPPSGSPSSGS